MTERVELKLQKLRVQVIVRLSNGHAYKGDFLLAPTSDAHHGHERVKDLLNSPETMVPFFNPEKEAAILLNKQHIQMVEMQGPDLAGDPENEPDFAEHRQLVVTLTAGIKIRGDILVTMPPGQDRTLDFLNRGEQFLYVNSRDGLRIINIDHLIAVEDFE